MVSGCSNSSRLSILDSFVQCFFGLRLEPARTTTAKISSCVWTDETSTVAQADRNMTSADFLEGVVGDLLDILLHGKNCIYELTNSSSNRTDNSRCRKVEWLGRRMLDAPHRIIAVMNNYCYKNSRTLPYMAINAVSVRYENRFFSVPNHFSVCCN